MSVSEPKLYRVCRVETVTFLIRATSPQGAEALVKSGASAAVDSHVMILEGEVGWNTRSVAMWGGEVQ